MGMTSHGESRLDLLCKQISLLLCCMLILDSIYSTLFYAADECRVTITLRQHHTLRRGQDIGTSLIDCSTLQGTQSWWFYAVAINSS